MAEVYLWNFRGKSDNIEALSSQQLYEIEICEESDRLGQTAQYSKISASSGKQSGMIFRLRHLNTGRLVVMSETDRDVIDEHGKSTRVKMKSIGLSEHLQVDINYT